MDTANVVLGIISSVLTILSILLGYFLKKSHGEIRRLRVELKVDTHQRIKKVAKANHSGIANAGDNVEIHQGSNRDE